MAFISQNQINIYTGQVAAQFDFFARPITIYKQPVKNIISPPNNILFGYGSQDQSTLNEITLTSISKIFSGIIIYPFKNKGGGPAGGTFDNKIFIGDEAIYVKLKFDGHNYISNGQKTEKIECDGQTFNLGTKFQVQNYLGLKYYYYELETTF